MHHESRNGKQTVQIRNNHAWWYLTTRQCHRRERRYICYPFIWRGVLISYRYVFITTAVTNHPPAPQTKILHAAYQLPRRRRRRHQPHTAAYIIYKSVCVFEYKHHFCLPVRTNEVVPRIRSIHCCCCCCCCCTSKRERVRSQLPPAQYVPICLIIYVNMCQIHIPTMHAH